MKTLTKRRMVCPRLYRQGQSPDVPRLDASWLAVLCPLLTSQDRWAFVRSLPSVVTSELEQVAADTIRTAFHATTPSFRGLIEQFLGERERLLKGP